MTEYNIILSARQSGKTYRLMTEIHEMIVAGRYGEVLVVFPAHNWAHWWVRAWQDRFPWVPIPEHISINNTLNVRGRRLAKVYVEDVDQIQDGIYNERFNDIWPALVSPFGDEEVVFTSSLLDINQRSHSTNIKPVDVLKKTRKRLWKK